MESDVLPSLSNSNKGESSKNTASAAATANSTEEQSAENPDQEGTHLRETDKARFLAQGEPVSYVIVGDGESGLEWMEDASIEVESTDETMCLESERVIVLEASSNGVFSSEALEAMCVKPQQVDPSAGRDVVESRKRTGSDCLPGQPVSKVILFSHSKDEACKKSDVDIKMHKPDNQVHTFEVAPNGNIKLVGTIGDRGVYQSKEKPSNSDYPQEPHKIMVVKEGDSSFINVYGSSHSSSSSTLAGSFSFIDVQKRLNSFQSSAPEPQQITILASPSIKIDDPFQIRQVLTSQEAGRDNPSICINSMGGNVELAVNNRVLGGEDRRGGKQKVIRVSGESGLVEGSVMYHCGECDYASANKHYYKQHVDLVHNAARPFKCPYCDYAGKRGHALREHLIVHSAQRFSCLHCNATFRKKAHLTSHTKQHTKHHCSPGLPGGLLGGSGPETVHGGPGPGTVHVSVGSNLGQLLNIPVPVNGKSSIITVKAEPSGHETTVLTPAQTTHPVTTTTMVMASSIGKRGKLWCELCKREMPDISMFQAHLKTVHETDRLFACDRCEYVTAKQSTMLNHLTLHIPSTSAATAGATATRPVPEGASTATPSPTPPFVIVSPRATGNRQVYTCTPCKFSTSDINAFISHAVSHTLSNAGTTVSIGCSPAPATRVVHLTKSSQTTQPQQISKAICSECGHVADSTEAMKAHLWTHITKPRPTPLAQQEPKVIKENSLQRALEQVLSMGPGPGPLGLRALPENTAFKCTECAYISRDASQFVKHMLVHKTQQHQVPRTQVQSSSVSAESAPGITLSGSKTSALSYKVRPITTENTCQNSESSPFVHDTATGRFRCIICGYTCEYQRTIKAHIWKHSGHHKVDYPIFQNGPLSMYEEASPSVQAAVPQTKGGPGPLSQTNTGMSPAQTEPPNAQILTPQRNSSDANRPGNLPAVVASTGAVPLSVKYITVSGSQVLQSSGMLPTASVRLIPMQAAAGLRPTSGAISSTGNVSSTSTVLSTAIDGSSRQVIVHVQGAQQPSDAAVTETRISGSAVPITIESDPPKAKEGRNLSSPTAVPVSVASLQTGDGRNCSSAMSPVIESSQAMEGAVRKSASVAAALPICKDSLTGKGVLTKKKEMTEIAVKPADHAQGPTVQSRNVQDQEKKEVRPQPGSSIKAPELQTENLPMVGDSTTNLGSERDSSTDLVKSVPESGKTSACHPGKSAGGWVTSDMHSLPLCAVVDKQQVGVAAPVHLQSEKQFTTPVGSTVSTQATSAVTTNTTPVPSVVVSHTASVPSLIATVSSSIPANTSAPSLVATNVTLVPSIIEGATNILVPSVSKGILRSTLTEEANRIAAYCTRSTVQETCTREKAQSPAEDPASKQRLVERVVQNSNLVPRMQSGTSQPAKAALSVVVEVVDSMPNPDSYTGLLGSQQATSPQVSHSRKGSPVPQDHKAKCRSKRREGSRIQLITSRRKTTRELKRKKHPGQETRRTCERKKHGKRVGSILSRNKGLSQTLQDSESAAMLLSLQNRVPVGAPHSPAPSYPSPFSRCRDQQQEQNPESPDRCPSSSSESDSVAREMTVLSRGASEDSSCEPEPSSGKNQAGSSGGICSKLLAVIEQLRERACSESDAEDKQSQPPVTKKRAGRRRGRLESDEEVLELQDSNNIEQLSGDEGVNYRCKLCHYTSPRVPLIRLHMRTHRQKDPFECSLCSVVAESSEALQEHIFQHCKVRTYTCKFCPQAFNHKSTLRAHMRAHNDSEPFMCDFCDFETANPLDYRAHMQKHSGSSLLYCPHCPAVLASRQDLRAHQATGCPAPTSQTPPPPLSTSATAEDSSKRADPTTDTKEQDNIHCPKCEFTSSDRARMEDHRTGHQAARLGLEAGRSDEPDFRYDMRGEFSVSVSGGGGLLQCALCDFTAVSSRSLKSHMKRHANDQRYVQQPLEQYKCMLCGYVCHHLPSLKSHMWRHASDENYSYQFTNDIINAAIDYDTRSDPRGSLSAASSSSAGGSGGGRDGGANPDLDGPELLHKMLSAEQKIIEGQLSLQGREEKKPTCWVTFRCCQCGFQTINKPKLNLHMRTHADIIQQALQVTSPSSSCADSAAAVMTVAVTQESLLPSSASSSASTALSVTASSAQSFSSSESRNIQVVYGPV